MRCAACETDYPNTARKCPNCGESRPYAVDDPGDGGVGTVIPYRNVMALLAYYFGVFGIIPGLGMILGPAALVLGILGLKYVRKHPNAKGTGHAITGIVLGSLELLFYLAIIVAVVVVVILRAAR